MRTILGVLLLLASSACAGGTDDGVKQSTVAESAPASVVYQSAGTVWVRPSGHASAVDVGTAVQGEPQHPDWSPDGTRLAFETDFRRIWTVVEDGSDARRLYSCTGACFYLQEAAWSPDGRRIAFVEVRTKDGVTTSRALVRVVHVADGHVRTIHTTRDRRVGFYTPRWSDDGGSLVCEEDVFASTRLDETVVRRTRVVTLHVNGRQRRVLASWRGPIAGPGSPAPDWAGKRVVFVRDDNLVMMDVDDGSLRPLTTYDGVTEHAIQPTFSSDATRVAFTYVHGTFGVDDRPEGAVVDVATGAVKMLDLPGATHVRLAPRDGR